MRADLVYSLVKFGISSDNAKFRMVVESIIAEERAKQHNVIANRLEQLLNKESTNKFLSNGNKIFDQRVNNLVQEVIPQRKFDDLILSDEIHLICNEVVQEQYRVDLLHSYNLEPRNRILLIGPPGNGKTSLAEAFAEALMVPLLVVRYDGVVGAYLGETAVRLRRLIDYASNRKCVLFFDEFETLGKERGDTHETGEIKRVVSSLLMQIDTLPSHVVVIGATNHPELLDRAVWRRFQVRMNLPQPTRVQLRKWFEKFEQRINVSLGYSPDTISKKLYGINFAEAEEFGSTVFRQYVLEQPNADMKSIVEKNLRFWKLTNTKTEQQNGGHE